MFGSRQKNEKPANEKLNSRLTLIGPICVTNQLFSERVQTRMKMQPT